MKKSRSISKAKKRASTRTRSARSKKPAPGGRVIEARALDNLEQVNLQSAGIDVGSSENYVCVPAHTVPQGEPTVRSFGIVRFRGGFAR